MSSTVVPAVRKINFPSSAGFFEPETGACRGKIVLDAFNKVNEGSIVRTITCIKPLNVDMQDEQMKYFYLSINTYINTNIYIFVCVSVGNWIYVNFCMEKTT